MAALILERNIVGVLFAGLVLAGIARAFGRGLPRPVSPWAAVVTTLLVALAVGVRLWIPPSLIHSNFHGYRLLDGMYAFPQPSWFRTEYGQGSFFVLGLVERVFGGGWPTVARTNALAGAATVLLAAGIARRAAGGPAGWVVMAGVVLQPVLVRTATSEDAHVLGAFFGMVALYVADVSRRESSVRWFDVVIVLCASVLAAYTRQSYAYWPLLVVYVAGAGRFRRLVRSPVVVLAFLVGLGLGVIRLDELAASRTDFTSYAGMLWLLPLALRPHALALHPLLRPGEGLVLFVLAVIGTAATVRRRDPTLVAVAVGAFFWLFVSAAMFVVPVPGVAYSFRVPAMVLLLPLVGAGGAWLWSRTRPWSRPARRAALAVGLTFLVVIPAGKLAEIAGSPEPLTQELDLMRANAAAVPSRGPLWFPKLRPVTPLPSAPSRGLAPVGDPPSYALPSRLLDHVGLDVAPPEYTGERWFLQGVACWAYSPLELTPRHPLEFVEDVWKRSWSERLDWLMSASAEPEKWIESIGGAVPTQMRPECAEAAARGDRFVPWGTVTVFRHDMPFSYFVRRELPVGIWHIPPE